MTMPAEILAQIAGVGMSPDAADLVAPTHEGAASVIRACLADANLSVDSIDYINAHGTVANDITEIKAIKTVFGDAAKRLSIRRNQCTGTRWAQAVRSS